MINQQDRIDQLKRMTRRPSTPGDLLADHMDTMGLNQAEIAREIGVSRQTVSQLIRGKRALTPDLAHRLGRLFGRALALWLNLQRQVDLWDTLHMDESQYQFIRPISKAA